MRLDKRGPDLWSEQSMEWWMVSQRYRGQKVASIFQAEPELPRSAKAHMLRDARKRVRTIIGRAERGYQRAQRRASNGNP
jgi:hypothetical protein